MKTLLVSTGRLPLINSRSMTPNEKTSDLSVSLPVEAYSGARYLYKEAIIVLFVKYGENNRVHGKRHFYPKVPITLVET